MAKKRGWQAECAVKRGLVKSFLTISAIFLLVTTSGINLYEYDEQKLHFETKEQLVEHFGNKNQSVCRQHLIPAVLKEPYTHLLTLFTTFKPSQEKHNVYSNTIHNWALFLPYVQPVLFTSNLNATLVNVARTNGWKVFETPQTNEFGTPILKYMYLEAERKVGNSAFYGFSNGDIMFTDALVNSLKMMEQFLQISQTCLMMIGVRRNYVLAQNETFFTVQDVMARKDKGRRFSADAEDYFFIARNLFPWKLIPNIVIGRPGYDNFMVGYAKSQGVAVVDISRTNLALHQTGQDGNRAGAHNSDSSYNKRLIRRTNRGFNYHTGLTGSADYFTYSYGGSAYRLRKRRHNKRRIDSVDAATRRSIIREMRNAFRRRRRLRKKAKLAANVKVRGKTQFKTPKKVH